MTVRPALALASVLLLAACGSGTVDSSGSGGPSDNRAGMTPVRSFASVAGNSQVVINHGSAGMYERLIRKSREMKLRASFSGVNSGSSQLVRHLGDAARGMVFSQVVPSPWERKTEITREYQAVFAEEKPGQDFSYGSLEGYVTAKALLLALRAAGPRPTREGFVRAVEAAGGLEISGGLRALYKPGDHAGLKAVDLAIVTQDLKFRH